MKKINKILLSTAVIIFAGLPVIVGVSSMSARANNSHQVGKTNDFKNFQHIILKGTWDAKIIAGDRYQVMITAPDDSYGTPQYTAAQRGDTLTISSEGAMNQGHFTTVITLPKLTNLELRGTDTATVSGFRIKDLSLSLDGTHSLTGTNNEVENLKLHAAGTTSIDLTDTKTTNVNLEIFGTSTTKLNMQGGDLTGQAQGAVSITYSGAVKTQTIETRGIAKVEARKNAENKF